MKILNKSYKILQKNGKYILNEYLFGKEKSFIINESIFDLLYFFNEPRTINEYFNEKKISDAKIKDVISIFYKNLIGKKILVDYSLKNTVTERANQSEFSMNCYGSLISERKHGEVYLVKKEASHSVLKRINISKHPDIIYFKKYKKILFNESEILKKIDHECIIKLLDASFFGNECFIELEFFEGSNLHRLKKNIAFQNRLVLIQKILEAYSYLHRNGILHGDIHLENILISENQNDIRLIDFGLAQYVNDQKSRQGGLHVFLPPERANKNSWQKIKDYNSCVSEVYQVGLVIYFIFFNKLPYMSETWHSIYELIIKYNSEKDININNLSNQYKKFLSKALSKNVSKRFKNCDEMLVQWTKIQNK